MNRNLIYLICLIIIIFFSTLAIANTTLKIRVGVYQNFPKIYTDEQGVVRGFWTELIQNISAKENWDIKWVSGTWTQGLKRLENGEINILPDTGWTEPRSRKYGFSKESVLVSWSRLYVPQNSKIKSIIDLNGKTIAALKGSFNLEGPEGMRQILHKFSLEAAIEEMESYEQVFNALQEGRVDAGVTNKDFGNHNEDDYAVERTAIIFQPARMQFAFQKNGDLTPFLIEKIDSHMMELKKDKNSIYHQILEKHIGGKRSETFIEIIPEWVKIVFVIAIGVIIFLIAVGITSRIQVRRSTFQLRESEEKYRTLINNSPDLRYRTDNQGKIVFISPSVLKLSGYTIKEALGMEMASEIYAFPDQRERFLAILKEHGSVFDFEAQLKRKDGSTWWASTNAVFYKDHQGNILGVEGVTRDITRRKKSEEEKIKAQQIAAEYQKLTLVGQVAGKMAHDFNNILGIIMGNTELCLMDINDEDIKKNLELILYHTIRGKNLTKNLLAFAKEQEPHNEYFSINEKIEKVLNFLKKDMEEIELIKENKKDVPDLLADPGMIEHAFVNLIQNAIHATSMTKHPRIIIRTYFIDENICFEIEDNGCGIPEKYFDNVFEPSFTLKGSKDATNSYKAGIKGTGYGMANVKKYIDHHKGHIRFESEIGSGTTFIICLPGIKKELTVQEKREIKKETKHFEKYILLVEDEQAISDVQYKILTQDPCNHKVDTADNGQAAMDLFDKNTYDFVSLDHVLPGKLKGLDVYHHIRRTDKKIPILFISGNVEFLESIKALKQKDIRVDHLSKPCQNKDYVTSINRLLDRS